MPSLTRTLCHTLPFLLLAQAAQAQTPAEPAFTSVQTADFAIAGSLSQ
jgi:hypothetical protein